VDLSRADPNLGTKAIAKPIGEARACIHEHAGRADTTHERAAGQGRLSEYAIGVMRAVLVDVRYGSHE